MFVDNPPQVCKSEEGNSYAPIIPTGSRQRRRKAWELDTIASSSRHVTIVTGEPVTGARCIM
ncbi:hypothetical protein M378DRAFT_167324 [Amanita muscaria Koide BX008]|uniref:Uncharacterized protein n=1 Tax=Amanita muscaria (strain Koide BX008) TaxID=946122 RepID=A0A0C2WXM6_AMAMK|nr:hypothetical protein M378DRAFT_167324 [Amanita muscaria Koide BX008]